MHFGVNRKKKLKYLKNKKFFFSKSKGVSTLTFLSILGVLSRFKSSLNSTNSIRDYSGTTQHIIMLNGLKWSYLTLVFTKIIRNL